MAGSSSLMPILLLAGLAGGAYLFIKECTGTNQDGTKKNCFGSSTGPGSDFCTQHPEDPSCTSTDPCANVHCSNGQVCNPQTGQCQSNPGPGGCNSPCSNGYKRNTSTCTCDCNRCIKGCGTNQVAVVSNGQCSCRDCPTGYHRSPTGACNSNTAYYCVKDTVPVDPCANKSCPSGYTKTPSGSNCNCICNKTCSGCTTKVATSSMCACVQNQGSSGNCGWDGNKYTWCATGCDGRRHCNTYFGNCSKDATARNSGCLNAKKSFCNTWSAEPSRCMGTTSGNPCCAHAGSLGNPATGFACGSECCCE